MNPKSRQKAATPVETDFFKLLNNRNFGIDCRNNIDNCILEPLYDDFGQISYIKKFTAIFNDDSFRHFFSLHHVREETIQNFQGKIFALDKNDSKYDARKEYFKNKMDEELDAKKSKRKEKFNDIETKIEEC